MKVYSFTEARQKLAEVLDSASQWEKGIEVQKEARHRYEGLLGRDAPETLAATKRLSGLYRRAGRWDEEKSILADLLKRTAARFGQSLFARRDRRGSGSSVAA